MATNPERDCGHLRQTLDGRNLACARCWALEGRAPVLRIALAAWNEPVGAESGVVEFDLGISFGFGFAWLWRGIYKDDYLSKEMPP